MTKESATHHYAVTVAWTGNRGTGTSAYGAYGREHTISSGAKPPIAGSSDPAFRGDAACWNPEDLLVASLSACHELWYLHLACAHGIGVQAYVDEAHGTMREAPDGGGEFTRVVLRPHVRIRAGDDATLAARLHHDAHAKCFIARSVNFTVDVEPTIETDGH